MCGGAGGRGGLVACVSRPSRDSEKCFFNGFSSGPWPSGAIVQRLSGPKRTSFGIKATVRGGGVPPLFLPGLSHSHELLRTSLETCFGSFLFGAA